MRLGNVLLEHYAIWIEKYWSHLLESHDYMRILMEDYFDNLLSKYLNEVET